eukprot:10474641-Alexandrium_andersonii.AAC.1
MSAFPARALPCAMCLAAFLGRTAPRQRVFCKRTSTRLTASRARTAVLAALHCVRSSSRVAYGVPCSCA